MRPEKEKQQQQLKYIEEITKLSASAQRVFNNEDGQRILDYMKGQVRGFDKDPYQHAFNAGFRRYHEIIEQLLDDAQYKKHLETLKNAGRKEG